MDVEIPHGGLGGASPAPGSFVPTQDHAVLWRGQTRFGAFRHARDYRAMTFDVLVAWNFVAVILSAYASAVIPRLLPVEVEGFGDFLQTHKGHLAVLAALLSPLLLGRRPKASPELRMQAQTVALAVRIIALFALVGSLGKIIGELDRISPTWLVTWLVTATAAVLAGRALATWHLLLLDRSGRLRERIAIVGTRQLVDELAARLLTGRMQWQFEVIGVFPIAPEDPVSAARDMVATGKQLRIDRIVLVLPDLARCEFSRVLHELRSLEAEIVLCPECIGLPQLGGQIENLGGVQVLTVARRSITHWGALLKTLMDRVLALVLLVGLSPLLLLTAIAIRLDSPGPVLFTQRRHGLSNTEFRMFKFRTMSWQREEASNGGRQQTVRQDKRVTRVGGFLRKSSIDELPQLLNVLRGEMSLVGPRPLPVAMQTQGCLCGDLVPTYPHRHRMRPGITGLAQVSGCRGAVDTGDELSKRITYDIFYVENWSLLLDLKIMAITALKLFWRDPNAF